ncbi:MAG: oxygenase MpaB family protein [Actinomycetota bacterium]
MEPRMTAVVNRERVLLAGGQRALVMQLAHPLVAAGVARHSDFPTRALARLRRTLDLSLTLIYGTRTEARAASEAIRAVHDRVSGEAEGRSYSANDPELLLWVNATLIDTTLAVYGRFVRRLGEAERSRYYLETVEAAEAFGIPGPAIPPNLEAFRSYVGSMLEGDELVATDDSRRLVRDVLNPPLPLPLRLPTAVLRQVTVAMLPQRVREMFDLRPGVVARTTLVASSAASRVLLPWLPPILRDFSRARAAGAARRE